MDTDKVRQWIENTHKGVANQETLLINASQNHTQCNLSYLQKMGNALGFNIKLLWLDGIQELKYRYITNQIVVVLSQDIKYFEIIKRTIARGVIYVDESQSINKSIELLGGGKIDGNGELSCGLLQKMEFEEVLKLDQKSLEEFASKRSWVLKKIHYRFEEIDFTFLGDYITIYSTKKILLANFAHYLYRLATLDFISTSKSVGATIHKALGVQSKTINLKTLKIRIASDLLKNHRVYVLNENQLELDTKMNIAKKLVALGIKELDVNKIANITELPLKNIEKIYRACFIR